jgi:hypothetical protein
MKISPAGLFARRISPVDAIADGTTARLSQK